MTVTIHGAKTTLSKLIERAQAGHGVLLPPLTISVACHAGYRGEETPRRFRLGDDEVAVAEILDQWLAPDHRYFKVLSTGGDRYILRHDVESNRWELTFFGRGPHATASRRSASDDE